MMQTVEAVVDEKGKIRFLESVKIKSAQRVWVTILPANDPVQTKSLVGTGEILDEDLESASCEISLKLKNSIENSARNLEL